MSLGRGCNFCSVSTEPRFQSSSFFCKMASKMYEYPRCSEEQFDIPLPKCMYKMDNIQTASVTGQTNVNPAVTKLLQRQQNILDHLDKLKTEVLGLSKKAGITEDELNIVGKASVPQPAKKPAKPAPMQPMQVEEDLDVVITGMPSKPPISAFVLFNYLKEQGVKVSSALHVHSSLKDPLPNKLKECCGSQKLLVQPHQKLNFTFIWKQDMFGPSLIVSPRVQTEIKGDANIARFLCRKFAPDLYEALDENSVATADYLMEICHSQILSGNEEDKKKAITILAKQIGKNDWLINNRISIADMVTWSALISRKTSSSSMPANLKKWLMNCNKAFAKVSMMFQ